jgi:hypothetical protein
MGHAQPSGAQQLKRAMSKFPPPLRALANATLARLRARLPGATELVYDSYALTIAFSPTDRPSHAVVSMTMYTRWINLGFLEGAGLDDPGHVLAGSGSQYRHVRLAAASAVDAPALAALIAQAVANGDGGAFDPKRRRRIDVRTASKKQDPRRPGTRRATTGTASPRPPTRASRPRGRPAR